MSTNISEFEKLLKMRMADESNVVDHIETSVPERLVANKNASLDDFMLMLSKIVTRSMKKYRVEFQPDEGARPQIDQAESLDHPYIFFEVLDSHSRMELKPRIRETSTRGFDGVKKDARRLGEVWGQWFTCMVQFNILAGDYKEATEVMNVFEDTIFTYTAYFTRNGVKDIRFTRRLTDRNLDTYRQKCSVRSLQYSVEIEKLFTRFDTEIEGIVVR